MPKFAASSKFRLASAQFTLSARADRIERRHDGSYAILDYKTGAARTEKQVRTGLAPQLTLEAAILRGGKFGKVARRFGVRDRLCHAERRRAGRQAQPIDFKDGTPDSQADHALARLKELAAKFEDEATPYRSLVHPMWRNHYGDYDHLARVKEWSLTGGGRRWGRRMTAPRIIPPDVRRVQIEAADPDVSAFVSANAGSGKTHVLAQRVINLLLRGVDPAKILCITFTKAAAANMANRVFEHAGGMDRARRRRARQADRDDSTGDKADAENARGRAGCSPRRWRRRAG